MSEEIKLFNCLLRPENALFVTQVVTLFVVICVTLANLTMQLGNQQTWTMVLTTCLAAMLPNPKFRVVGIEKSHAEQPIKDKNDIRVLENGLKETSL